MRGLLGRKPHTGFSTPFRRAVERDHKRHLPLERKVMPFELMARIPILTYHALHAPGWEYSTNDHVAFEHDLGCIRALGFRVASLVDIAECVISETVDRLAAERVVGVSFDDGTDHDWHDFSHPGYGELKSMATILREQGGDLGWGTLQANATSFVIVSPEARTTLDRTCIAGREQWRETWWREAAESGVLTIANHSWDHAHIALDRVAQRDNVRGDFRAIDSFVDAERQIGHAERYLRDRLGPHANGLFAYPYGQSNSYLVEEYLPRQELVRAAFVEGGRYVTPETGRWTIPRFSCQSSWQSPAGLRAILEGASG